MSEERKLKMQNQSSKLVDIAELFNRDNVTNAEWSEALQEIKNQESKQWAEFLVRRNDFDDAIYSDPFVSRYRNYVEQKGLAFEWLLVDMNGKIVDAKIVDGKFGKVWAVNKEDGSTEWVNVSSASTYAKEQAHYNKKGYQIAMCEVRVRTNSQGNIYFDWNEVNNIEIAKDE